MRGAAQLRLWTLLARVRQLRVERRRRLMNEARIHAQRAAAETARQRNAIGQHEARRCEILAACAYGDRGATLWRMALHRHDSGRFALEEALAVALQAERLAEAQVVSASRALQREMAGADDARERGRRLKTAQQEGCDPED
jgi:hypothetical protein